MIKPFGERVLIEKLDEGKETVEDGIVIPKSAQGDGLPRGRVVATSEMAKSNTIVNDIIVFNGEHKKIMEGDKTYYLVDEKDILAINN